MRHTDSWSNRSRPQNLSHHRFHRRLAVEQLEDRRMLATFTVTNLDDAPVAMAGEAPGTLRQAVFDANATEEADVIEFQNGLTGTILLTGGELAITRTLSIDGPGANLLTIDASGNDPTPDSTLADGDDTNDGDGSRIFDISDGGPLSLIDVSINGVTLTGGDADDGGAIRTMENLMLLDTVITENVTTNAGGAINFSATGLFTHPTLSIHRSTISHNQSKTTGGGVFIAASLVHAEIIDSLIAFNSAGGDGGGVYSRLGDLKIQQSTLTANTSDTYGGGIYFYGRDGGIPLTITLNHSVITGNTSDADESGTGAGGGVCHFQSDMVADHTVIAANADLSGTAPDVYLYVQSMRFSLIGDGKYGAFNLPESPVGMPDANGNLVGGPVNGVIDPMLGPLADNGGPTMTHALLAGSPAIDAGDPNFDPADPDGDPITNDALPFDQRGTPFARLVDGDGTDGAD